VIPEHTEGGRTAMAGEGEKTHLETFYVIIEKKVTCVTLSVTGALRFA